MLFWLFRTFLQSLFISNATNPPFTLGLRVKGDKRARLTSFPRQKGGEKHETIFFSDHNSVNDTLRMYKNDDIRMYNFDCITDTIVEVITTCNTYTLLTVHLL